jgi:hypothetical protein
MEQTEPPKLVKRIPYVGGEPVLGTIVETLHRPETEETVFAICTRGKIVESPTFPLGKSECYVPYSPHNNLLKNRIILFPSKAVTYESEAALIDEIRSFIHRYVDISPLFEVVATYYVLLSWVHEAFNELPYLRIRGDFGSGKTRFLLTIGALCFRPIFASGASTISPLFRMLDKFRGTLLIDEGDIRLSDEKAELVKILNNGNARGFPVLRSEQVGTWKEFNPVAYNVFGPKIVATRGFFQDRALESRFLTEESGGKRLRSDIPISLPTEYEEDAQSLRNKLLMFRFRNLSTIKPIPQDAWSGVEPRFRQIFTPLMSLISNEETRSDLLNLAARYSGELMLDRQADIEAHVLWAIRELQKERTERLSVGDIARKVNEEFASEYERRFTEKRIGAIIRKRLQLKPERIHGVFVITAMDSQRLKLLFERYGLSEHAVDVGDVGDVA